MRALLFALVVLLPTLSQAQTLRLNDLEYFDNGAVNVMVFQDIYPDGHQGGVGIIQHGERVATNGDLRLDTTPGQWQPMPRQLGRTVDPETQRITARLAFPDPDKNRTGFNPIVYPDLDLTYSVTVTAEGDAIRVRVDLDEPLPAQWAGTVGFNMELFPGLLFGKTWYMDEVSGLFPPQPNGPTVSGIWGDGPVPGPEGGAGQAPVLARGNHLTVAPEAPLQTLEIISHGTPLALYDGRIQHNNGWFVVRSLVEAGARDGAVDWLIRPHAQPDWVAPPVIHVSQVGYHPNQPKRAVLELDKRSDATVAKQVADLVRFGPSGEEVVALREAPVPWGQFLRYQYRIFDFSGVTQPGIYRVRYAGLESQPFRIERDIYARDVWQPTLEYFLPVQMCHMRVEEQYRVWHGLCHMDDARLAPADSNHFDGYHSGPDRLIDFTEGETVPGINIGGWHDAGDDDLRIESQADEVLVLSLIQEEFHPDHDDTYIDQDQRVARIHQPDGKPDLLQQIEHGVLSILGMYQSTGRLYDGIIVPTLRQYVLLGDVTNSTDNLFYDGSLHAPSATHSPVPDDRWVFVEEDAGHEYKGIAALAAAGRVMREYNPELSAEAVAAARSLWEVDRPEGRGRADRIKALVELLLTTGDPAYRTALVSESGSVAFGQVGWSLARALRGLDDPAFAAGIREAARDHAASIAEQGAETPFGVPYRPHIWGAGWGIQQFGFEQYFLHRAFPDLIPADAVLNSLNFILGVHPGTNRQSFASGVGSESALVGYGLNRADWSYIPGGSVSGTALIRPDFAELKVFPFLWQQVEYVMGGGATHFMFLAMAADELMNR